MVKDSKHEFRPDQYLVLILKPEAFKLGLESAIIAEMRKMGFRLKARKDVDFFGNPDLAEALYDSLNDSLRVGRLFRIPVLAIQAGTTTVLIFKGDVDMGQIATWLGPTMYDEIMATREARESFRGRMYQKYGRLAAGILADAANFVHMGENPDREIRLFWNDDEIASIQRLSP